MSVTRILMNLLKNLGKGAPRVRLPRVPSYKVASPYPIKSKGTPGVSIDKSYRSQFESPGPRGYVDSRGNYKFNDDFPYFNQWSPSIGRQGGRNLYDVSPHAGKIFGKEGAVRSPYYPGSTMLPSTGKTFKRFTELDPTGKRIYEPARRSVFMQKGRVPEYYERFPKDLLERSWGTGNPKLLQDFIRKGYSSPGIGRKLGLMESRLAPGIGQRIKRMESLAGHRLPNPRKAQMMEGLMAGRGKPGIAQGLGKMKGRAYSSLNQPGSVVAGTKRSFTNLLRTDKNFEKFVVDMVGPENVTKIMNNPKIRKTLVRDYLRTVRTGVDNFPPYPDMGTPATIDDIMKMYEKLI